MKEFYDITEETKVVGPILFITRGRRRLGKVIANTDLVDFVQDNATTFASVGLSRSLSPPSSRPHRVFHGRARHHRRYRRPSAAGPWTEPGAGGAGCPGIAAVP